MAFDPRVPGTVCRFDLGPYSAKTQFDVFVVSLDQEASESHLVKCLIIGFDSDELDVKVGEIVELPHRKLRSFELE